MLHLLKGLRRPRLGPGGGSPRPALYRRVSPRRFPKCNLAGCTFACIELHVRNRKLIQLQRDARLSAHVDECDFSCAATSSRHMIDPEPTKINRGYNWNGNRNPFSCASLRGLATGSKGRQEISSNTSGARAISGQQSQPPLRGDAVTLEPLRDLRRRCTRKLRRKGDTRPGRLAPKVDYIAERCRALTHVGKLRTFGP
jgi:hypothetical protein